MEILSIDQPVQVTSRYAPNASPRKGKIAGYATLRAVRGEDYPVYLVRLDSGFYTPESDSYVSVLVCAHDVVEAL